MEGFEIYISSNGYLIIPDLNIKYLIDFNESSIPSMPEATEATVRIAGRDGDIVLKTTYEPIPFNISCYTPDNLTLAEKTQEEAKVNQFLNGIKNTTTKLGMEKDNKFYDVKYSGALTTINYPKHLKFNIPLKSSDSYAKYYQKSTITGDATFTSNTIKEVGAKFIINGPATNFKLYLNDYEMFYESTVLEGNQLIIDSGKSTATLITPLTKSNAMRYYNHQFPKIQPGENIFRVETGISDDTQVSVEWYDLKL